MKKIILLLALLPAVAGFGQKKEKDRLTLSLKEYPELTEKVVHAIEYKEFVEDFDDKIAVLQKDLVYGDSLIKVGNFESIKDRSDCEEEVFDIKRVLASFRDETMVPRMQYKSLYIDKILETLCEGCGSKKLQKIKYIYVIDLDILLPVRL